MVNWLFFYVVGVVPAMLVIASIAFRRRTSHGMRWRAIAQLTLSASLVWPLLAVAALQVGGLLLLARALDSVRGHGGCAVEPANEPATEQAPVVFEPAAAAA